MNILIKKLIRDYIYHQESLVDIKEISDKAEVEFRQNLQQSDPEAAKALVGDDKPKPEPKEKEKEEKPDHGDKSFKKIYRKITMLCHPDKIGEDENLLYLYQMATQANEEYDWGLLLKVALELKVEIKEEDLTEEQLENIKEKTNHLKKEIHRYENSMAYKWYLLNDLSAKEQFMLSCAQVFKKSLKE